MSDHGFAINDQAVDLGDSLVRAGLKESSTSDDVVIASSQALKLYDSPERGADLLVSFAWSSDISRFGVRGVSTRDAFDGPLAR